jgi:phage FluMu protein Com
MIFQSYRCPACAKLLFKGILVDSEVEVKCRGCGTLATFHGISQENMLCYKEVCPGRKTRSDAVKEGKHLV